MEKESKTSLIVFLQLMKRVLTYYLDLSSLSADRMLPRFQACYSGEKNELQGVLKITHWEVTES